jgi:hypothetical protein
MIGEERKCGQKVACLQTPVLQGRDRLPPVLPWVKSLIDKGPKEKKGKKKGSYDIGENAFG